MTTRPAFSVELETRGAEKLLRSLKPPDEIYKAVSRGLHRAGLAVQREAAEGAAVDTGLMRSKIVTEVDRSRPLPHYVRIGVDIKDPPYPVYVELGTGIYGPKKQPIRPKSKKALAFTIDGVKYVRRSVKGMRPRPFMGPALKKAMPSVNAIFRDTIREIEKRWKR